MQGELPRKRVRGFEAAGLLDLCFSQNQKLQSFRLRLAGDGEATSLCTREALERNAGNANLREKAGAFRFRLFCGFFLPLLQISGKCGIFG